MTYELAKAGDSFCSPRNPVGYADRTVGSEAFRRDLECSLGRGRFSEARLQILEALKAIYKDEGVFRSGEALRLWDSCRCAKSCWEGLSDDLKPGFDDADSDLGAIPLPWVGEFYEPRGVVVVAINLHRASGFYIEYEIAAEQLRVLASGGKRPHGGPLAYGSARAASAVLESAAGRSGHIFEAADELAMVLDRTARLQAVKCSRNDHLSPRTDSMKTNCPPLYLRRELAVLKPSVVVNLGNEAWDAIDAIGDIDESVPGDHFSRSRVRVEDLSFEMVWLHHPAARNGLWEVSLDLLLSNLAEHPIGTP